MKEGSFLGSVSKNDEFRFVSGKTASNIYELLNEIEHMSDGEFSYHLNNHKNDFANWIKLSVGDSMLALSLSSSKTKSEVVSSLKNRIVTLSNKPSDNHDVTLDSMETKLKEFKELREMISDKVLRNDSIQIVNEDNPSKEDKSIDEEAELLSGFLSENRVIDQVKSGKITMNRPLRNDIDNVKESSASLEIFKDPSAVISKNKITNKKPGDLKIDPQIKAPRPDPTTRFGNLSSPIRLNEFFQIHEFCEDLISKNEVTDARKVFAFLEEKSKNSSPAHSAIIDDALTKLGRTLN